MKDDDLQSKLYGTDLFGNAFKRQVSGKVSKKFYFPPFSVLDARGGAWQDRKRAWKRLGIDGEIGRSDSVFNIQEWTNQKTNDTMGNTSIFDPVLCECIYRWFCPPGGQVVDPFAGASVRGVVAGTLGMKYWGCELRAEQVDANKKQAAEIQPDVPPEWVCGDSMNTLASAPDADLVFSCPPYGDLEKYSDDPADLSSMEWHTFKAAYGRIILRAVKRLKPNRFACFVVGDFRDKRGFFRDFVSTTIAHFRDCGAELYNEAILVTSVGTASLRVSRQFDIGRKFAKTHQNVLVFCKGDWRKAAQAAKGTTAAAEEEWGW